MLVKLRPKEKAPASVGVYCTVKVVVPPPPVTVVDPGAEMELTVTFVSVLEVAVASVRSPVPEFVTVKVRFTAEPAVCVPCPSVPPSAIPPCPWPVSATAISGAPVAVPESVKL